MKDRNRQGLRSFGAFIGAMLALLVVVPLVFGLLFVGAGALGWVGLGVVAVLVVLWRGRD